MVGVGGAPQVFRETVRVGEHGNNDATLLVPKLDLEALTPGLSEQFERCLKRQAGTQEVTRAAGG